MKKILLLLALFFASMSMFGQAEYEKIKLTQNEKDSLALKLNVQSASDEINFVLISELFSNISVDTISFNIGEALTWNSDFKTLNIPTGLGPVLQTGQEFYFIVFNNTGVLIPNGAVIDPVAAIVVGSEVIPTVALAKADTHETCSGTLFIATADIPIGGLGVGTLIGRVGSLDTSGFSPGDNIYLSATTAGEITNVMPEFPAYIIQVGGVIKSDVSEGVIGVNFTDDVRDTFTDAWDGSFRETLSFLVSSDGVNIIGTLERAGGGDLTKKFSDGFSTLDCTPAIVVPLTAGTDTDPQMNYVSLSKTTGLITVSLSEFPTDEHIRIADVLVQSAATVQTKGDLFNRNHNDHVKTVADNGHILHITDRMRQNHAAWDTGVFGSSSVVGASNSDVFVSNTSGFVYQLHRESFPSSDTSTGDDLHIVNDFTTPFTNVSNLNGQNLDALGASLANKSFSFVLWGVQNKSGEESHLMINLPIGSYAKNSPDLAVSDPSNLSVYRIPSDFKGKGFLIARFTYTLSANGLDWILFDTQDLRGFIPNSSAGGGGGGGSGITEFLGLLDTPNSYSGEGGKLVAVTSGETALEFIDNPVPTLQQVTDAGNVTTTSIQASSFVQPGEASPTYLQGKLTYDTDNESLTFFNDESDISLQVGQEQWTRVRNASGSTIVDGTPVYISGNHAGTGLPEIDLAKADVESTSKAIGLTTHDIENNTIGYVTTGGVVGGLNTSSFGNGDELFLSAATAGTLTATKPSSPDFIVSMGFVTKANASSGTIIVMVSAEGLSTLQQVLDAGNSSTTSLELTGDTSFFKQTRVDGSFVTLNGAGGFMTNNASVQSQWHNDFFRLDDNTGDQLTSILEIQGLVFVNGPSPFEKTGHLDYPLLDNESWLLANPRIIGAVSTTAPATPSSDGSVGEIRVTATDIHFASAPNTWVSVSVGAGGASSVGIAELKAELKAESAISAVDVVWTDGVHFTKTLTVNTTLTFSGFTVGKTITLEIDGNFTLTLPSGVEGDLSGFDGAKTNIIQLYCVDAGTPKFIVALINY